MHYYRADTGWAPRSGTSALGTLGLCAISGSSIHPIVFLRHSKAVASAAAGDHARALSARGRSDAQAAGTSLAASRVPDFALVSDARRTRETFDLVVETAGRAIPHRFDHALYGASPDEILAAVAGVPPETACLLVIGHNPGLGELARQLSRRGDAAQRGALGTRFPTSAFAIVGLDGDWGRAAAGGTLEAFWTLDSSATSD